MWVRLAQLLLEDLKCEFGAVLTDRTGRHRRCGVRLPGLPAGASTATTSSATHLFRASAKAGSPPPPDHYTKAAP